MLYRKTKCMSLVKSENLFFFPFNILNTSIPNVFMGRGTKIKEFMKKRMSRNYWKNKFTKTSEIILGTLFAQYKNDTLVTFILCPSYIKLQNNNINSTMQLISLKNAT